MRSTKTPSRGPITTDVRTGEQIFANLGCAICHVPSIITSEPGTAINGGAFIVPAALGNKVIHPYSDFLFRAIAITRLDVGSVARHRPAHASFCGPLCDPQRPLR